MDRLELQQRLSDAVWKLSDWLEAHKHYDEVAAADDERFLYEMNQAVLKQLTWCADHDPYDEDSGRFALVVETYCVDA